MARPTEGKMATNASPKSTYMCVLMFTYIREYDARTYIWQHQDEFYKGWYMYIYVRKCIFIYMLMHTKNLYTCAHMCLYAGKYSCMHKGQNGVKWKNKSCVVNCGIYVYECMCIHVCIEWPRPLKCRVVTNRLRKITVESVGGFHILCVEWRRPLKYCVSAGHFAQKNSWISGWFAELSAIWGCGLIPNQGHVCGMFQL